MQSRQEPRTGQSSSTMPPRGDKPGLKRGRHNLPYWIAGQVARDTMGFPDKCIPLPPDADDEQLGALCRENTARLQLWIDEQKKLIPDEPGGGIRYDGTVYSACQVYQKHPLSRFHKVKRNTRGAYVDSLKVIESTVGKRLIRNLTILDCEHWYDNWRKPAFPNGPERIDRAHDAISMFKTVMRFNAALRRSECKQLVEELKLIKFEKGGGSEGEITYNQARAFITTALDMGRKGEIPFVRALSLAIGTAGQFELMLRQKDMIGEWCKEADLTPRSRPLSIAYGDEFWTGYFRWDSIPGWRWRMKTSKSKYRSPADFDLQSYSLLFPLLELVPHDQRTGPIVKAENGLPMRESSHRSWWRDVARRAGIPDDVQNRHNRAGGASEADDAEAPLDAIQAALTHEKPGMTLRYIKRGHTKKIAVVAAARDAKRRADQGGGTP